MRDEGVGSWTERWAGISPDQPAIIAGESMHTYGELAERVRRLANGLRSLGVARGDRVCWLGPNHPAFLETLFATAKLGAVLSAVNHRLDDTALGSILEDSRPRAAITNLGTRFPRLPSSVRSQVVVGSDAAEGLEYESLISESPADPIDEPVGLDDLCMLPYTSGTTGGPKGVMLTHGNITWNVVNMLSRCDFRGDDVTVAIAPFFRVGGTGVNVLPALFKGGTVVVPEIVDADEILRLMEQHRVTVGFGNPDLLEALTRSPQWGTADLSSVRFAIAGGAPVPERLVRTYLDRGVLLLQGYGLSEAAPAVLLLDPTSALRKPGSAGRPFLLVDVQVVLADGTPCRPGETGELLVQGPNVMAGYWNRPDATRNTLDEAGWLHTGDAVRMDEDGDVWIVDRVTDGYLSSGHMIYPGDVERVLVQRPEVVDVGVVGIGNPGEQFGVAFAVLDPPGSVSEAELLAFCRERLPEHAVPRSVVLVDAIPRTSVAKILRSELRRLAEASTRP